ncbi:helix-turn-helix transcriptional regulator [Eubacteriales bacterium OttesenSCG-928-A19]|nr:helix-turn-helix transcriptional regulator [Eubacteriales bacterium OttesenSCG-928-A19]
MGNRKQHQTMRRRMLTRWIAMYLVIVAAVLCIVSVISSVALRAISEAAKGEQRIKMQHARVSIDTTLEEIERALVQISTDEFLQALSMRTLPYTPNQLSMLHTLNQRLRSSLAAHYTWMDAYVYFHRGEYVIQNGAKHTLDAAFPTKDYAMTRQEWVARMDALEWRTYLRIPSARNPEHFYVECWWPMVGQGADDPLGILAVRLNDQSIRTILSGMKWYSNELMLVLDEHGDVLFSSDPVGAGVYESLTAAMAQRAEDTGVLEADGLSIGYALSGVNGWTYLSVLDGDFLVSNFSYTGRIAQALLIILLICGVAVSVVAARMRYRPLSRLYDLAEQSNLPLPTSQRTDAFEYVEHSMITMMKNYQSAHEQLARQNRLVRNHVLIRLLTDNIHSIASFEDVCFSNGIYFVSDRFMVLVFNVLNESDVFFGEYPSEDDAQISSFIVSNIFQELLETSFNAFVLEYDSLVVGIINPQEQQQTEAVVRSIGDIFQRGQRILQTNFGLLVACQISGEERGYAGIARAYDQAMEILECQQLMDQRKAEFTRYEDVSGEKDALASVTSFNIDSHIRLVRLIRLGDFEQAKALITGTVERTLSQGPHSAEVARYMLFSLMNALLDAVQEISADFDEAFVQSLHPIDRLLRCTSIVSLQVEMCAILDQISAYLEANKQDPYDLMIEQVKARVASDLNTNLNVSSLADELGVSISALSRLFKKRTGQGLLNYINEARLEKAKDMLLHTDATLSEIADATGLINSGTLIRIFKRHMGITPGKYKQRMLAQNITWEEEE